VTAALRPLIAVLAFNEEATIADVVRSLRSQAAEFDLVVVDDGSQDRTAAILRSLNIPAIHHLCNLGYGRAVQTAITYAARHHYDALITFDGDGQHRADDLPGLWETFLAGDYDLLIGSRFVASTSYASRSSTRRIGMSVFSAIVRLVSGRGISDTTSGFRIFGRRVFGVVTSQPFADFHAETIVLLLRAGYKVGEGPIVARERYAGVSMYTRSSALKYPLKTSLLILIAMLGSRMMRQE
jgi:glycosyltransferase involved in cell wall biosynthesis